MFHASLKCTFLDLGYDHYLTSADHMQLIDELSMIYTTCFMFYATFAYSRSTRFSVLLGTGLVGLAWFITVRLYRHSSRVYQGC